MTTAGVRQKLRRTEATARVAHAVDFHAWALQQAECLRQQRFADLDRSNLADEIVQVSRREYAELESALARLLQHLLKWDHQPQRRSRSWLLSIAEQREVATQQLGDNPGLKSRLEDALARGYARGRRAALAETGLPASAVPERIPYDWDDIMERIIVWPQDG